MLVQAGNPGSDLRKELAEQLKRQIEFESEQLRIHQRIAELRRHYTKARLDRGRRLCAEKTMRAIACEVLEDEHAACNDCSRVRVVRSHLDRPVFSRKPNHDWTRVGSAPLL